MKNDIIEQRWSEKLPRLEKEKLTITELGLKSWFYREVENQTYSKIGKILGLDSRNVPSCIKRFKENYRIVLKLTQELGDRPLRSGVKTVYITTRDIIEKRRREGLYWGSVARGLKIKDGKLAPSDNIKDVELVVNLFKSVDEGKTLGQLSQEFKLSKQTISRMLRNRNYRGVIIDPALFDRVQEKINEWGYRQKLPYGVKFFDGNGDPVWDEEKKEIMVQAINDRKDGKSWREIAEKYGWSMAGAKHKIMNPLYCGMRWKDGKLVKAHNRPIVSVKTWCTASKAKAPLKGGLFKRELEKENRNKILASLNIGNDKLGLTVHEIIENTGLSRSCVKRHLKKLEKENFVVNDPPFWRRKF